jgi:hypothetical protein
MVTTKISGREGALSQGVSESAAVEGLTHATSKRKIVVVDFGKRQSRKQVKQLRKGHGKLMARIDDVVNELTRNSTLDSSNTSEVIVVVVREREDLPWPFGS